MIIPATIIIMIIIPIIAYNSISDKPKKVGGAMGGIMGGIVGSVGGVIGGIIGSVIGTRVSI